MIKDEWIGMLEDAIVHDYKFRRGLNIHNQGLVFDFEFEKNGNEFTSYALVEGSYDNYYNTSVYIKKDKNIYISLDSKQEKIYLAHFLKAKKEISEEIQTSGFNKSQIKILSILTRLRQICCHPSLFIDN